MRFKVVLLFLSFSAHAGEIVTESQVSLFERASSKSKVLRTLKTGNVVRVISEQHSPGEEWLGVEFENQSGYVDALNVVLSEGDFGFQGDRTTVVAIPPWNYSWMVATSPMGLLNYRYNLQMGRFYLDHLLISIKGTYFKDSKSAFHTAERNSGYEIGVRANLYAPDVSKTIAGFVGSLGIFFAKNTASGVYDYLNEGYFASWNKDEVSGPMLEALVGIFARLGSQLWLETLFGVDIYQTHRYRYDESGAPLSAFEPHHWKGHFVIEGNVGLVF